MPEDASEVRRLLDAYPWAGETPRLRLLGFDVVIRTDDAELSRYLSDLYEPLHAPGAAAHVLSLSRPAEPGPPRWAVHLDARRVITTPAPSIALDHLLWEANRQAIDATDDLVLVHASAAAFPGGAIVLPGPMGAGKSTLVAALVRSGLGYLTDEVVALDPATGLVQPYPKYLSLGPEFAACAPEPPAIVRAGLSNRVLVPPERLRAGAISPPAPPRVVVTPRYERGATTELVPLHRAAALSVLAEHAFHLTQHPVRTLRTLEAVVEGAHCYQLVSSDIDDACTALLGLLDQVPEPARS
jgi:hypothetical protein